eukprot:4497132-Amphidinium_carterae.1
MTKNKQISIPGFFPSRQCSLVVMTAPGPSPMGDVSLPDTDPWDIGYIAKQLTEDLCTHDRVP